MHINHQLLHHKGWKAHEIEKAVMLLKKGEQNKSPTLKVMESTAYWLSLLVAVLGNIAAAYATLPLAVLLPNINYYLLLIILGICLGTIFTMSIHHLDLEAKHHTVIIFTVPLLAFFTFFIITQAANAVATSYKLNSQHNPVLAGIFYLVSFLLPHLYLFISKHTRQYHGP